MFRKFLFNFAGDCPCRVIHTPDGQPYLERYFLFRFMGYTGYIHRFLSSDSDRGLHDHPMNGRSLILSGCYDEIRLTDIAPHKTIIKTRTKRFSPGMVNKIDGTTYHRVVLPEDVKQQDVWTLFWHGPRFKPWGFLERDDKERYGRAEMEQHDFPWWKQGRDGDPKGKAPLGKNSKREPYRD